MRVLRVYHAGRDAAHRRREAALVAAGVDVHLVVPAAWPDDGSERELDETRFAVTEVDVTRPGDVNRHRHADDARVRAVLDAVRPDVLDLHEEPFSAVSRQWLRHAPADLPVVMYTAQNLDKRFPPPFHQYEQAALARVDGLYPCSLQAASVVRGKGSRARIDVLPLGVPASALRTGDQDADDGPFRLAILGRLVPEKGVRDAVRVLAAVAATTPARLTIVGTGPELGPALHLAESLGVREHVEHLGWQGPDAVSELYRTAHVVLVPSTSTATWVEQFGRVIVEAQAAGAVVAGYASGSIPEVVGDAGLLVGEGEVDRLAGAVTLLAENRALWKELRDAGAVRAAGCSWAAVAAGQVSLYRAVLDDRRVSARTTARAAAWRTTAATRRSRRARAVGEFGPPATCAGGDRPFALPFLREPTPVSRFLGRVLDEL